MTQSASSSKQTSPLPSPSNNDIAQFDVDQQGDISLDASFSQVSLASPSPSTPSKTGSGSHTPAKRNGHLSPLSAEAQAQAGGYFPPLPASPSPTASASASSSRRPTPLSRVLSKSPSPSPTPATSRSSTRNLDVDSSPSKVPLSSPTSLSPPHSAPPSRLSFRRSPSRSPPPAQPQFLPFHPPILASNDDEADLAAPFESIPLHASTPPPPDADSTVPLPSSPRALSPPGSNGKKIQSWGGFGMTKEGVRYANGDTPTYSREQTEETRTSSMSPSREDVNANIEQEVTSAGPSTPRRLHAPPAHPFPFPVPSSSSTSPPPPPPSVKENKRASVISTASGTSSQPNASGPSQSSQAHHGGLGVKGISTFEKVISHTRPSWLPPKDHDEDETHLHQWEEMMKKSREHEKEMKKLAEVQRIERERRLALSMPRWEALLGSDFSVGKVQNDPGLRKMWFEGIPSHLRGKAWAMAIGNPLALSKDAYKSCVARARKAIESGRFPQETLERMEEDLDQTLVTLRLFGRGSPLRADLHELLCAWVVYRSNDGLGYAPYTTLLGAMFLLVSPPPQAFSSLVNLLTRPCLRAFFTETTDEIDAYYRVFENLQADTFPKIYANCKNLGLKVPESWFRSLLVEQVPFEAACRLWDQIVLDGDGYIFRAALAIFGFLEPRLYYPDREEILSVLEGRNSATLAITQRERQRAKLRGEAFDEALDGKLSVFGLHEGALFDWLEKDGWKERGFERLVTREMPD